jgi:hypothetical protein
VVFRTGGLNTVPVVTGVPIVLLAIVALRAGALNTVPVVIGVRPLFALLEADEVDA